ncbi:oxygen-independent coproporphyrinogen III oxidase [Massilia sp. MS-15]|uniref:oxygen-independent coproporphyrinogen III oxidase n=1 Tax=Massilia sp. MS-15 TaxID=2878200 RepID=UPI001CD592A5|nr:oxygen-independent coproporphyrinogen III oxidase [Massilia sp. MS-15]MCA1246102.1 oxygen-independent coproporphyrinogen III oxidase [Massilia sp. MS-15]
MTTNAIPAMPDVPALPSSELIARMSRQGPRYTSYPTADRFAPDFGSDGYRRAVASRRQAPARPPLSLYVHIPFCQSLCYYCACNKIVTGERDKAAIYLGYLLREIDMQAALYEGMNRVEQLHFGGGTPTYLSGEQMGVLTRHLRERFDFAGDADGEYGIEIDPRTVDAARIAQLRAQGFNRISLGVQDFDPEVQQAVNRIQPESLTLEAIAAARAQGFRSISIDLIYGLPKQSVASMRRTLDKVVAVAPDRISVYSYAHMPELFKSQRLIREEDMPSAQTRLDLLALCIAHLTASGYVYIGMDHFARPDDELALAQRAGRLHRNFQGYSTHAEADMLSCGVSAISAVAGSYCQNEKSLGRYYAALDRGQLPVARGIRLSLDDLVRRDLIGRLMCDFDVDLDAFERRHGIGFASYFGREQAQLDDYAAQGLLVREPGRLRVTSQGRFLVRNICMVFDRYLGREAGVPLVRMPYSRTV